MMEERNQLHDPIDAFIKDRASKAKSLSVVPNLEEEFMQAIDASGARDMLSRLKARLMEEGGKIQLIPLDENEAPPQLDNKDVWGHAGTYITVFAREDEAGTKEGRRAIIARLFHEIRARSTKAKELFEKEYKRQKFETSKDVGDFVRSLRAKFENRNTDIEDEIKLHGRIMKKALREEFAGLTFAAHIQTMNRDHTATNDSESNAPFDQTAAAQDLSRRIDPAVLTAEELETEKAALVARFLTTHPEEIERALNSISGHLRKLAEENEEVPSDEKCRELLAMRDQLRDIAGRTVEVFRKLGEAQEEGQKIAIVRNEWRKIPDELGNVHSRIMQYAAREGRTDTPNEEANNFTAMSGLRYLRLLDAGNGKTDINHYLHSLQFAEEGNASPFLVYNEKRPQLLNGGRRELFFACARIVNCLGVSYDRAITEARREFIDRDRFDLLLAADDKGYFDSPEWALFRQLYFGHNKISMGYDMFSEGHTRIDFTIEAPSMVSKYILRDAEEIRRGLSLAQAALARIGANLTIHFDEESNVLHAAIEFPKNCIEESVKDVSDDVYYRMTHPEEFRTEEEEQAIEELPFVMTEDWRDSSDEDEPAEEGMDYNDIPGEVILERTVAVEGGVKKYNFKFSAGVMETKESREILATILYGVDRFISSHPAYDTAELALDNENFEPDNITSGLVEGKYKLYLTGREITYRVEGLSLPALENNFTWENDGEDEVSPHKFWHTVTDGPEEFFTAPTTIIVYPNDFLAAGVQGQAVREHIDKFLAMRKDNIYVYNLDLTNPAIREGGENPHITRILLCLDKLISDECRPNGKPICISVMSMIDLHGFYEEGRSEICRAVIADAPVGYLPRGMKLTWGKEFVYIAGKDRFIPAKDKAFNLPTADALTVADTVTALDAAERNIINLLAIIRSGRLQDALRDPGMPENNTDLLDAILQRLENDLDQYCESSEWDIRRLEENVSPLYNDSVFLMIELEADLKGSSAYPAFVEFYSAFLEMRGAVMAAAMEAGPTVAEDEQRPSVRQLVGEAWEIVRGLFAAVTAPVDSALIARVVNEHKNAVVMIDNMIKDQKIGFIFSHIATFGDPKDGPAAEGLGVVLPVFANNGVKVAILLDKNDADLDAKKAIIGQLNEKIEKPGNKISYGTNIGEIESRFKPSVRGEKPARFYYLKTAGEDDLKANNVIDSISIIVHKILGILGRLSGIVPEGKEPDKLYEAARKFAQAA
ncbi:MAG: hypothetical protein PHI58_04440 [Candidatus Omnitrophica bacterium]|nr:hypothetical protein [Candidatus Omnitrophota bacterium]